MRSLAESIASDCHAYIDPTICSKFFENQKERTRETPKQTPKMTPNIDSIENPEATTEVSYLAIGGKYFPAKISLTPAPSLRRAPPRVEPAGPRAAAAAPGAPPPGRAAPARSAARRGGCSDLRPDTKKVAGLPGLQSSDFCGKRGSGSMGMWLMCRKMENFWKNMWLAFGLSTRTLRGRSQEMTRHVPSRQGLGPPHGKEK